MNTQPTTTTTPDSPGPWAAKWTELKMKHLRSINTSHEGDFWMDPENVRKYLENTRGEYGKVVEDQLRSMKIATSARVLDIGSGPGTLAVPLAKKGCRVTIVEQSPLMCAVSEEYRREQTENPIRIITRRWEEVTREELEGPFDVIIASFSLTMSDIRGTIQTIQAVSSGRVFLFWFLTLPSWAEIMIDLWPSLHQRPYHPTPLADCLWNVLYEMGIYAHIEVMDPAPPHSYDSVEQVVKSMTGRLECTEEWQREIIRSYIREKVLPTADGTYLFGGGHRSAKIWWDNSSGFCEQ